MHATRRGDMSIHSPRVAVVGDVGGNRQPFYGLLRRLGVKTSTNQIPKDLVIVQVGDLIGPHPETSAEILRCVQALRQHNHGQWIQLMGNWESRYLANGVHFQSKKLRNMDDLDPGHQRLLENMWDEPFAGVAATIENEDMTPALITHAGVTRTFLHHLANNPSTDARIVARFLNMAAADKEAQSHIFAPGEMYQGTQPGSVAGPLWASPSELWRSWNLDPLPYDQIVGHAAPYMFNRDRWFADQPIDETKWATPLPERRMTYWNPPHSEHGIAHIDPTVWRGSGPDDLPAHIFQNSTVTVPKPTPTRQPIQSHFVSPDGELEPHLASLIANVLKTVPMTTGDISQATGLPTDAITAYATGDTIPSIDDLERLVIAIGGRLTIGIATSSQ